MPVCVMNVVKSVVSFPEVAKAVVVGDTKVVNVVMFPSPQGGPVILLGEEEVVVVGVTKVVNSVVIFPVPEVVEHDVTVVVFTLDTVIVVIPPIDEERSWGAAFAAIALTTKIVSFLKTMIVMVELNKKVDRCQTI